MTLGEARYVWEHHEEYPGPMVQLAIRILKAAGEL